MKDGEEKDEMVWANRMSMCRPDPILFEIACALPDDNGPFATERERIKANCACMMTPKPGVYPKRVVTDLSVPKRREREGRSRKR